MASSFSNKPFITLTVTLSSTDQRLIVFWIPHSPRIRYQVRGNWERLPSYEREKCSQTKQGSIIVSFFLLVIRVVLSIFFFFTVTQCGYKALSDSQEVLELAFSVLYDPDETLNFVAPNKYEVSSATLRLKAALHRVVGIFLVW